MLVYRLEKGGIGPYRYDGQECQTLRNAVCDAHRNSEYHPVFPLWDTATLEDSHKYRFGCRSLEALQRWFGGFWEELISAGFEVCIYETEDSYSDGYQLAFIGEKIETLAAA